MLTRLRDRAVTAHTRTISNRCISTRSVVNSTIFAKAEGLGWEY